MTIVTSIYLTVSIFLRKVIITSYVQVAQADEDFRDLFFFFFFFFFFFSDYLIYLIVLLILKIKGYDFFGILLRLGWFLEHRSP